MTADLYQTLAKYTTRHARLKDVFLAWHTTTKELPKFGNPPLLASMEIGEIGADGLDPDTFKVSLAGTTVYVRFAFLPGQKDGEDGVLQAYVLEPISEDPVFLHPISFKGTGAVQMTMPDGDQVMLGEQHSAFFVIALLMKAALERK
ncbi:MAG: hypothetical protein IPI08_10755 [Betaproteobacteria bacterium]|nr:hypothetical protein [Betaproteobacteria bacterium]